MTTRQWCQAFEGAGWHAKLQEGTWSLAALDILHKFKERMRDPSCRGTLPLSTIFPHASWAALHERVRLMALSPFCANARFPIFWSSSTGKSVYLVHDSVFLFRILLNVVHRRPTNASAPAERAKCWGFLPAWLSSCTYENVPASGSKAPHATNTSHLHQSLCQLSVAPY